MGSTYIFVEFHPKLGFVVAVTLPMPFIILDPVKSHQMVPAFVLPTLEHFIGNIIEHGFSIKTRDTTAPIDIIVVRHRLGSGVFPAAFWLSLTTMSI